VREPERPQLSRSDQGPEQCGWSCRASARPEGRVRSNGAPPCASLFRYAQHRQVDSKTHLPEAEPRFQISSAHPGKPVLPAHLRAPLCSPTLNTGRRSPRRVGVNSERFASRRLTPRCSGPHPGVRPGSAAELRRRWATLDPPPRRASAASAIVGASPDSEVRLEDRNGFWRGMVVSLFGSQRQWGQHRCHVRSATVVSEQ
jgi:hypothetical protein